jgi:subtilisin-like proprotein convertase family protein
VDLYVSQDPALTNLDATALAAAGRSVSRSGIQTLIYTNANPGAYFVAVKCESPVGAEYGFAAVFSDLPFDQTNDLGGMVLRGFPSPAAIPGGTSDAPGEADVFCLAPDPLTLHRVLVTNVLTHPGMSNLLGTLCHLPGTPDSARPAASVVLNNHSTNGSVTAQPFIYDDSGQNDITNAQTSDGPGSLQDFGGRSGSGQWRLTQLSTNSAGTNESLSLVLEPQQSLTNGITSTLEPGSCREDYVSLPFAATNLTLSITITSGAPPLSIQFCALDNASNCQTMVLSGPETNAVIVIDDTSHPPPHTGVYQLRLCNLSPDPLTVTALVSLGLNPNPPGPERLSFTGPLAIPDDAVSSSSIHLTNTERVVTAEVGVVIDHPHASDLQLRLRSPAGTTVLLTAGRGGDSTNGMGFSSISTVTNPASSTGGPEAQTNIVETGQTFGTLFIGFHMYTFPDDMKVYYQGQLLYDSGLVSGDGSATIPYGPGTATHLEIVMNQGGSTNSDTAWDYTVGFTKLTPYFLNFTEDTNLASFPIKFAPLPLATKTISNGLFYFPEESLRKVTGELAGGIWSLDIADTSVGATDPPPALITWQLSLRLQPTVPVPIVLNPGVPTTNTIGPGLVQWFSVEAPPWASVASNYLLSASANVAFLYNPTTPPTGTNLGDITLCSNCNSITTQFLRNGFPPLFPGTTYFLGILNTNATPVTFAIKTDFDVTHLDLNVPLTNSLPPSSLPQYFSYTVTSNETAVTFQLTGLNGEASLVVRKGFPPPTLGSYDYASFNPGSNAEEIIVFTNSTLPLSAGLWYVGVYNVDTQTVSGVVLVTDYTNPIPNIITLNNAEAYSATNFAGGTNADYYHFVVSGGSVRAQFEINNPSGDMTLVVHRLLPLPDLTTFDYESTNPSTSDELITVFDTSSPVALSPGDWFLTAVNVSSNPVSYSIKATDWPAYGTNVVMLDAMVDPTNGFSFEWPSLPGLHYFVQAKAQLPDVSWTLLSTLTATDYSTPYSLPLPSPWHYFRIGEGIVPVALPPAAPVISKIAFATNGVSLSWLAPADARFQVRWTPELAASAWNSFTNVIGPSSGVCSFLDDGSQSGGLDAVRFYRVVRLP